MAILQSSIQSRESIPAGIDLPPITPICANQILYGTWWSNYLAGACGDDRIWGFDGNDRLVGHAGNDTLYGGYGNDSLYGGSGDDDLFLGAGDDYAATGSGADYVVAGGGNDTVYAGAGHNTVNLDAGNDLAYGGTGIDWIFGGDGNDTIYGIGGNGEEVISGNAGDDLLVFTDTRAFAQTTDDTHVIGGAGDDELWLTGGVADALGGSGDDIIVLRSGPQKTLLTARGDGGKDAYHIEWEGQTFEVHITGLEPGEFIAFHDVFAPHIATLDTNGNGVLDAADTYITTSAHTTLGLKTAIDYGALSVAIFTEAPIDASQIFIV